MEDKVIRKQDLSAWVAALAKEYEIAGPVASEKGPASFKDIDSTDEIVLDNKKPTIAPREFLLPRYDLLFKFNGKKGQESVESGEPQIKPRILFGLRLCDARAIQVTDNVYMNGRFRDPYYANRREGSILVATVCTSARWGCFCTSIGNPLDWQENLDATMTDIGDKIYVSPRTEKGEKIMSVGPFEQVSDEDKAKKQAVWDNLASTPTQPFAGTVMADKLDWDDPIWAKLAEKCIGCGVCTYMCPSCSCFDIQDETKGHEVERFRCRDTCQFSDFTHMGHGHNPRPEKTMRFRQRVMHKFKYQPEQFGMVGCSGCGRCVELCPINIDIRNVLSEVYSQQQPIETPVSGEEK